MSEEGKKTSLTHIHIMKIVIRKVMCDTHILSERERERERERESE